MVNKDEFKVVWSGPQGEGEYTAIGAYAALGYGIQARHHGADKIKVIHQEIELSFEEFDKKWRRV